MPETVATSVDTTATTPDALAVWFASAHRDRLRYVAAWKRWMAWDGACWRRDETLLAIELARAVCGRAAGTVRDAEADPRAAARLLQRLGGAAMPGAVERLARSDRALAAADDQWDRDPDLLNTPSGIVDTRTGATLPHRPESFMSRITTVAPAAPGTPHPLWSAFLDRVTGGNADLAFYLQRVAGYALTGHANEHALFFAHGTGANGKSLFVGTLARILGGYADAAPVERVIAGRLRTDNGTRLATVEDGSDGMGWSASRVKALAGGTGSGVKLLIAANDRPNLGRADEAVKRRLHLIPFAAAIPEAERDPHLAEKLAAEHPAILRWAIDGALAWRRIGLAPPDAVRDARDAHLAAEDAVAQWLEGCTAPSPGGWVSSSVLYDRWRRWCRESGEAPGSQKRFSQTLQARGFTPKRKRTGHHGFVGLALRDDTPETVIKELCDEMMERAGKASSPVIADDAAQAPCPPPPIPRPPLRPALGKDEGRNGRSEDAPSCVVAAPLVPPAQWRRLIRHHLPSPRETALVFDSPVLAGWLTGSHGA